jgi:hypothetical protein
MPYSARKDLDMSQAPLGLCRNAGEPLPTEMEKNDVRDDESLDSQDQPGVPLVAKAARIVVDFAVGPAGVGPVMGFNSDDFFPLAPDADLDGNRTVVDDAGGL